MFRPGMQSTSRKMRNVVPSFTAARAPTFRADATARGPRPGFAVHYVGCAAAGGHEISHCWVVDRDDDVDIGTPRAAGDSVELSVQVLRPSVGRVDHGAPHGVAGFAYRRAVVPMASAARAAAPAVCHRFHLVGSEARACRIKDRHASASDQPVVATARPCLRSVSAVVYYSLNGCD
jgi:hypothetical protein